MDLYNSTPLTKSQRIDQLLAFEANIRVKDVVENNGIGVTESMKLGICTDRVISDCRLRPVTSPIMFNAGYVPAENGLFDPDIFGQSAEDRKRTYAYIDLKNKYFHPYVYEIITSGVSPLSRAFKEIATGLVCGCIDPKTGELIAIKDSSDKRFNEKNTGIPWLVSIFHQIKWKETEALVRKDRIRLLNDLSDEEIFISKYLVVPIFYRDIEWVGTRASVPKVNTIYNQLIQYSNASTDDIFASFNDGLYLKIQENLVALRQFGQSLIEKKNGLYHRGILGKTTDYGSRDVISVAVMNEVQHPKDNPIDIFHTGLPLAKCIVTGYPFMSRYCVNFFEDNFKNKDKILVYVKGSENPVKINVRELKDHTAIYDKSTIDKYMKRYINTYGGRFETIKVFFKDGTIGEFYYTGFAQPLDKARAESATIIDRPMTWTDLFYLAAMDTCADKYLYVTRFPLENFTNIYPAQCMPLSTIKTQRAIVDGRVYSHYPVIDLSLPSDVVATLFIDTLTMSNLYLSGMGADFDGDTTQEKMLYSLEANEEAAMICHSLKHFLSARGSIIRDVGNEAYLTFYNMTRLE